MSFPFLIILHVLVAGPLTAVASSSYPGLQILQENSKSGEMFAHAGMVGAATAILRDLDNLGILTTLIQEKPVSNFVTAPQKRQDLDAITSAAHDTTVQK